MSFHIYNLILNKKYLSINSIIKFIKQCKFNSQVYLLFVINITQQHIYHKLIIYLSTNLSMSITFYQLEFFSFVPIFTK